MTELKRLERELFQAARREAPPPALRAVLLAGSRQKASRSRGYGPALAAAAALAAGALLYLSARDSAPEPATPVRAERLKPQPTRASLPSARVEPPAEPSATAESKLRVLEPPKPKSVRSLAEQLELLKQARGALRAGNPVEALSLLDRYTRGGNSVDMSAEATLLRIEALAQLGRRAEARQLAQRFIEGNPDNPLVDRARVLAGGSTSESGMGREDTNEQLE